MAQVITENKIVMGVPVYRFEIETEDGKEYFDQGWKAAVKAEQLSRKGIVFKVNEWDKKEQRWFDNTKETVNEGVARMNRSRVDQGKDPVEKQVVPTLSEGQIATIKGTATTLNLVAQYGKKQLPDEETKQQCGMELMQVLTAVGYSIKDIKHLVNQYDASLKAAE